MEFLNEAQLAAIQDREFATVEIPEWNAKVEIGSLCAQQAIEFDAARRKGDNLAATRILLAGSLVNKERKPFAPATVDALLRKGAAGVARIVEAAQALNKTSAKAQAERGEE